MSGPVFSVVLFDQCLITSFTDSFQHQDTDKCMTVMHTLVEQFKCKRKATGSKGRWRVIYCTPPSFFFTSSTFNGLRGFGVILTQVNLREW